MLYKLCEFHQNYKNIVIHLFIIFISIHTVVRVMISQAIDLLVEYQLKSLLSIILKTTTLYYMHFHYLLTAMLQF